jgi:selenide,water dikinase
VFGKIAANHSLSNVYAMGGTPQSALAVATLPYGIDVKVEADLAAMMAGANEILSDVGCALVGGHTAQGAELALGFAVNGLVERGKVLRKRGVVPGDALILTKPVGTGTLIAANSCGKAKARWTHQALMHMIQSNRQAVAILREHRAHAMTDIAGFGLIGHLCEIARASDVDVFLTPDRVPLLDGARETVAAGILSSLQAQNMRARRAIADFETASGHPPYPLLFDPQTGGGLLAAVPMGLAGHCVAALHAAGYAHAAVVGVATGRSDGMPPITLDLDGSLLDRAIRGGERHNEMKVPAPAK